METASLPGILLAVERGGAPGLECRATGSVERPPSLLGKGTCGGLIRHPEKCSKIPKNASVQNVAKFLKMLRFKIAGNFGSNCL